MIVLYKGGRGRSGRRESREERETREGKEDEGGKWKVERGTVEECERWGKGNVEENGRSMRRVKSF